MDLGKDFRELLELLNRHQVRYLAVGGFAVAVHGRPRYTKDLDLWIGIDFLTKLTGVEFADAYPKRTSTMIGDIAVAVLDRESMIANKRALGRPHDLDDTRGLEHDDKT